MWPRYVQCRLCRASFRRQRGVDQHWVQAHSQTAYFVRYHRSPVPATPDVQPEDRPPPGMSHDQRRFLADRLIRNSMLRGSGIQWVNTEFIPNQDKEW